ncbi:wax ester/triacylglycerol synthase family O-acyltransferase [Egicoccus sp. AB-alg6-2]|uniref:WS/DGAT/MGAT family O-acyltransferase n=1 Tax=Egicoccus sp. AB-alg6-2 TaxID=3242692 RepID=UPI00359D9A01
MRPVPVTDAIFLLGEGRGRPLHVGGLQLFQPPRDGGPDFVREQHRIALAHEPAPLFRQRATRTLKGLGPWAWTEDDDLDLEYHVRHSALPHPGSVRELLTLVSRLHGTMLDRNRPLWESHVIEGLADGRLAVYTKVHHALLDGTTAMKWLLRSLSEDEAERDMPPPWSQPARSGGTRHAAVPAADGAGGLLSSLTGGMVDDLLVAGRALGEAGVVAMEALTSSLEDRTAALPYQAPRTILNQPITAARRFAAQSWDLDRVKAVGAATGGKVNDVVLAMTAGALRRYLVDQQALPDRPLIAAVPVSLRDASDRPDTGNAVGVVLCNLGTHLADPMERFALIHRSMRDSKSRLADLHPAAILLLSVLSFGPVAFGPLFRFRALRRPAFNLVVSNVPGPSGPRYWNGARLDGLYPASVPYDGQALNVTVTSHDGELDFGLTGCRARVPSLQRLLDHLEASLVELEVANGLAGGAGR